METEFFNSLLVFLKREKKKKIFALASETSDSHLDFAIPECIFYTFLVRVYSSSRISKKCTSARFSDSLEDKRIYGFFSFCRVVNRIPIFRSFNVDTVKKLEPRVPLQAWLIILLKIYVDRQNQSVFAANPHLSIDSTA